MGIFPPVSVTYVSNVIINMYCLYSILEYNKNKSVAMVGTHFTLGLDRCPVSVSTLFLNLAFLVSWTSRFSFHSLCCWSSPDFVSLFCYLGFCLFQWFPNSFLSNIFWIPNLLIPGLGFPVSNCHPGAWPFTPKFQLVSAVQFLLMHILDSDFSALPIFTFR